MANSFLVEIDPREKTIKKIEFNEETIGLEDLYAHLDCTMVERVSLYGEIDLWIDEEGMLNNSADRIGYFNIGEYQFVGKGLICMSDEEGDSVPLREDIADYVLDNFNIEL